MGYGRTDAMSHVSQYFFQADIQKTDGFDLQKRLKSRDYEIAENALLPLSCYECAYSGVSPPCSKVSAPPTVDKYGLSHGLR